MISVPKRILLAREAVDFRKQIDGLAALCEQRLNEEPLDGTLFLFINRRKTAIKALIWTRGGFVLLYKRLEKGRFWWPDGDGSDRVFLSRARLAGLVEGLDLSSAKELDRWNPRHQS